ncbi:hypothetical protein [Sandarakinorhabdus sp.]|uniref:hypothetical protein n=1 Tax=Sandarakinorhabdus sp. TaxID=1916663 RepID=UPI0028AC6A72|nr:hypothetical protein [Sandarakinorhabdus sp.]
MKAVRFKQHWQQYNAGETASFAADIADALVRAGVADDDAAGVEVPALSVTAAPVATPAPRRRRTT